MARQEEIINAVDTIFPIPPSEKGRKYVQALMATGFEAGVKWADEHPKSPWISVKDDLPCNHSDLVLTYNDIPFSTKRVMVVTDIHTLFLCEMKKDDDRGWIWNYSTKDKITIGFQFPNHQNNSRAYARSRTCTRAHARAIIYI